MAVFVQVLAFISATLLANEIKAMFCSMGQEADPQSHNMYRWVIPVQDPCQCTEVRVGSLNTQTPRRSFKVTYYDTFLHSNDPVEVRQSLNCPAVACSPLPAPGNGVVSSCVRNEDSSQDQIDSTCYVTCNEGYSLQGSPSRHCLRNGTWDGSVAECLGTSGPTWLSIIGKPTTQSSTYDDKYQAHKAADGSSSTDNVHCTHTTPELLNPWWTVDLQDEHCINRITILNRGDCCSYRLTNAVVRAGSTKTVTDNPQCGLPVSAAQAAPLGGTLEFVCQPPLKSRYISVDIPGHATLQLCEVQVEESPLAHCQAKTCALSKLIIPDHSAMTGCSGQQVPYGTGCTLTCNNVSRPASNGQVACETVTDIGVDVGQTAGTIMCRDEWSIYKHVGLEYSSIIPDSRFDASSIWHDSNSAANGRLNTNGYWCQYYRYYRSWIEVNLGKSTLVSGVITQGSTYTPTRAAYRVMKYKVAYTQSTSDYYEYVKNDNGDIQIFSGNIVDGSTPVIQIFTQSINAVRVRIWTEVWYYRACLRFELLGYPL